MIFFNSKKRFLLICIFSTLFMSLFLLMPFVQNLAIHFGELLVGRELTNFVWIRRMQLLASNLALLCLFFLLLYYKVFSGLLHAIKIFIKSENDYNWLFNVFLFPLIELFLFYSVSSFLFLIHIPVTKFNFIICYIVGELYLFKVNKKYLLKSLFLSSLFIAIPIIFSMLIWDFSWDGNAYHKLCVGLIKEGWNPVYQTINDSIEKIGIFDKRTANSPFYDGYPKASYIISAVIYAFTDNIEAGKAYTWMSMISALGIIYYVCKDLLSVTSCESFLLSAVLCINTVTVSQAKTYYNDGFLHLLVFIVCAELFYLYTVNKKSKNILIHHIIVSVCIIIGVNLKYSAMLLLFLPCLAYFICIIVKKKELIGFTAIWYCCIVVCALFIFGETSYIHNIVFHHNPLYTMIGKEKMDVLSPSIPLAYRKIPNFFRLLFSIFSPYNNNDKTEVLIFKTPFSVAGYELDELAYGFDTRMGGWGIFFSGLFCLSLIVFVFRLIKYKLDSVNVIYFITLAVSFLPAIFINCLVSARYWPFMFFFPVWIIYIFMKTSFKHKRFISVFLISLCIIPVIYIYNKGYHRFFKDSQLLHDKLFLIKNDSEIKKTDFYFRFPGIMFNLLDNEIDCHHKYITNDENLIPILDIGYYYKILIENINSGLEKYDFD